MRIVLVLLNVWLTVGLLTVADEHNLSREAFGKYLIVLAIGFLSTWIHELGHAAAAWKVGYRIRRIAVLPFEFDVIRRRFAIAKVPAKSDIAGYVEAVVPTGATRKGAVLFALGGPLAEATMAIALFASLAITDTPSSATALRVVPISESQPTDEATLPTERELRTTRESVTSDMQARRREEILRGLASMLAVFALGSAFINLLPIGGSDGHQIWKLLRRRVASSH